MRAVWQRHDARIIAVLTLFALAFGLLIPRIGDTESTSFRAGDVGFSLETQQGQMWVYGDSWANGRFVRNAIVLNGEYKGTLRAPGLDGWIWPGAPFQMEDGRVAMYGSQYRQAGSGIWGFQRVQTLKIVFEPSQPQKAQIRQMGTAPAWSAQSLNYKDQTILYGIDANHRSRAAYVNRQGDVGSVIRIGSLISGRYTVLQDHRKQWWMVGLLPWLSRKLVAYPMSGPTVLKSRSYRLLQMLPLPAQGWFVYDALVHPELDGLLTWAENGKGPGGRYGLHRQHPFWPSILRDGPASRIASLSLSPSQIF